MRTATAGEACQLTQWERAVVTLLLPCEIEQLLDAHEKAGAVEVPIHEQSSQDKSFEKLFHARIIGRNE